jgi:phage-related protein
MRLCPRDGHQSSGQGKAMVRGSFRIPEDYGKHLRDGVWELRVVLQYHQHRFLYSFWKDIVVVTNAFLKKSGEVPDSGIEKSRKAMADWISRRGWEDL